MDSFISRYSVEESSSETHVRLAEFAAKMGFTGNVCEEDLKRLCKGEMKFIFEHIMASVRPAPEVEAIRRTILKRRTKLGEGSFRVPLKQLQLVKEKNALQAELAKKYEDIRKKEEEVQELRQQLVKLCHEAQQLMTTIDNTNKKTMLLRLNADSLREKIKKYEELSRITLEVSQLSKVRKEQGSGDARAAQVMAVLQECHERVGMLQQHYRDVELSGEEGLYPPHEEKVEVLAFIQKSVAPFSAKELLEAVMKAQLELNQEMKDLIANVDHRRDAREMR